MARPLLTWDNVLPRPAGSSLGAFYRTAPNLSLKVERKDGYAHMGGPSGMVRTRDISEAIPEPESSPRRRHEAAVPAYASMPNHFGKVISGRVAFRGRDRNAARAVG